MSPPEPFAYPSVSHVPTHAPAGYARYGEYKPWLRDDFMFRCVYCLTRERWHPAGHVGFGADHLVARSVDPALSVTYSNLVYACNTCNSLKGVEPPPLDPRAALGNHLAVGDDGVIRAHTPEGQDLVDLLDLGSPERTALRAEKLTVLRAWSYNPTDADLLHLFHRAFGYPDDLPDLDARRPPGGNGRAGSETASHHARRQRNELSDVY